MKLQLGIYINIMDGSIQCVLSITQAYWCLYNMNKKTNISIFNYAACLVKLHFLLRLL